MNDKITFIDHTANVMYGLNYISYVALNTLSRYPIEIYDFKFEQIKNLERVIFPFIFRMEADTDSETLNELNCLGYDWITLRWQNFKNRSELEEAIEYAKTFAFKIFLKVEDSILLSDSDLSFYAGIIEKYRIDGFIYHDGSCCDPFTVYSRLKTAMEILPCEIEFSACNLNGLAAANTLAAIKLGIRKVHTSVGGIDMSCSAAMEEVCLCCRYFLGITDIQINALSKDCHLILDSMDIEIPLDKASIGENIFAYESGIHADGIMKNPRLYEVINPAEIGLHRKLIIGKHSGKSSIKAKLEEFGVRMDDYGINSLTQQAKKLAVVQKSALSEKQFMELYSNFNVQRNLCS